MGIYENVLKVREEINKTAIETGRNLNDIKILGVTKTRTVDEIKELLKAGVNILGENKVQEFLPKYEALKNENIEWHFIGNLQRNKVKYIIDKVNLIHSVNSLSLAAEINKQAKKFNKVMDILIEVNIAKEENKYGIMPEEAAVFYQALHQFDNIKLCGLMCIAPFVKNAKDNAKHFRHMCKIAIDIKGLNDYHCRLEDMMKVMSFGMSGDFLEAIACGATIVRLGTILF